MSDNRIESINGVLSIFKTLEFAVRLQRVTRSSDFFRFCQLHSWRSEYEVKESGKVRWSTVNPETFQQNLDRIEQTEKSDASSECSNEIWQTISKIKIHFFLKMRWNKNRFAYASASASVGIEINFQYLARLLQSVDEFLTMYKNRLGILRPLLVEIWFGNRRGWRIYQIGLITNSHQGIVWSQQPNANLNSNTGKMRNRKRRKSQPIDWPKRGRNGASLPRLWSSNSPFSRINLIALDLWTPPAVHVFRFSRSFNVKFAENEGSVRGLEDDDQ